MKVVKVQYTVKENYVETNKANIAAVMAELRSLEDTGVKYAVFLREDGRTFMHLAATRDEEASKVIPGLESFRKFREQLQAGAETKPAQEKLVLVDSSFG